ncbi:peptidase [Roseibium denhamense]|uniref:Prepilin peptidase CpaA n=1 Tax=Roseibium denhamense TaxID=76305 RepID=A0ABY1NZY9_9HYPH|nr:prepilin peptidase [Roseibium denhamense]MTI04909.1 peptidase [Roseibium denhamense]SMP22996.1 prepilin peptidase CpaA [Roseibium denhamense]
MLTAAILSIFPFLVAFGGISDLFTMTIRNGVSILLIAGFCVVALFAGLPAYGWGVHALGLIVIFVPFFICFAAGWMGGGDVKFISAIALWIGYSQQLGIFILLVAIYGMILTFGLLLLRNRLIVPEFLLRQEWFARLYSRESGIPYGIAIAAAGLQTYTQTTLFSALS